MITFLKLFVNTINLFFGLAFLRFLAKHDGVIMFMGRKEAREFIPCLIAKVGFNQLVVCQFSIYSIFRS
ncbi:hypothetical protein, partial [Dolichospermum sp. UHCC 0260]|uniref:hypothetical protein n=1 Tax=Dolichospermum sp. UHCC 0260 TaxID=2590025 RepID=UPI001C2C633B